MAEFETQLLKEESLDLEGGISELGLEKKWREMEEREGRVELREMRVEERLGVMAGLKGKENGECREAGEGMVCGRCVEVERRELGIEEVCRGLEEREGVLEERVEAVGVRERGVEEGERRGREIEGRFEVVEIGERELREGCRVFEEREKELSARFEVVVSKEKELSARFEVVVSKEKELSARFEVVVSKEKEVSEGFRGIEERKKELDARFERVVSREEELSEGFRGLEGKEKELSARIEMVQLREKELNDGCRGLEERKKELDARFEMVELKEKELNDGCRGLEERKKELDACFETVELKEKELNDVWERKMELDARFETVELKEKELNDGCRGLEERKKELDARFEMVELKEKKLNDGCRGLEERKKELDARFERLELRDKGLSGGTEEKENELNEGIERVVLKEKGVDERSREVESREKEVSEGFTSIKEKEKELNARFEMVVLREKELSEGCRSIEEKRKELKERFEVVELKEKGIDDRCREVELREKKIDELNVGIKLEESRISKEIIELERRKREVDDCSIVQEIRDKQFNERAQRLAFKDRDINWCLQQLELKERRLNERSRALDLKEKLVDEHCMVEELREKETGERLHGPELEKNIISKQCKELESQGDECSIRDLETKEKKIDWLSKVVELRQKEIDERCQVIIAEENRISNLRIELERKKTKIDDCCKAQELTNRLLNEHSENLLAKESQLDGRLRNLEFEEHLMGLEWKYHVSLKESKRKEIDAACQELELNQELLKELSEKIRLLEKQLRGSEFKEKYITESFKVLELKEKQIYEHFELLKLKDKEIAECWVELELEEKQIKKYRLGHEVKEKVCNRCCQERESSKKEITETCQTQGLREKQLSDSAFTMIETERYSDMRAGDGETLLMLLNDRVDERSFLGEEVRKILELSRDPSKLVLAAVNGFFPQHLKEGNMMYVSSTVRSSCVLLLEQFMSMRSGVCENMREKATRVARRWRQEMREEGESRITVLGFLLLVVAFQLTPLFARDELKRLWQIVCEHKTAAQLRLKLDLFEESEGCSMFSQLDIRQLHSDNQRRKDAVATSDVNLCSEIQSACRNMDTNCLRLYLNQHVAKYKLFPQKVLDALQLAPEPAKLVFNVFQSFSLPQSSKVDKISCIFLLEQLMKLQKHQSSRDPLGNTKKPLNPPLQITRDLRNEAKGFAAMWKSNMAREGYRPLEVYGFLQFLATYRIANSYHEDELFKLFRLLYGGLPVYWPEETPYLCRALGLTWKIPGLIISLVKENSRLQAVKYICAFMLESDFPLAPLLNDHVKFIQDKAVTMERKAKNNHSEKVKAIKLELSNLREVLQYIKEYKLETEYSSTALESRIKKLVARIGRQNSPVTEVKQHPIEHHVTKLQKEEPAIDYSASALESRIMKLDARMGRLKTAITVREVKQQPVELPVKKMEKEVPNDITLANSKEREETRSPQLPMDRAERNISLLASPSNAVKRHASPSTLESPQHKKRLSTGAVLSPVMLPHPLLKPCLLE